jgi:FkbM family methyltransferase
MIEEYVSYIGDKMAPYIIFDIGSRDCEQSIEFYKHFPNAKIFAFECNPNTLPICRKNILPYKDRITLVEGAVCDYDGTITFYPINQQKTITTWKDGNPGASSLFKSNGTYKAEHYVQDEITTNCHRLDTVMSTYGIPAVDILWMDLQGAELLALKGLGCCIEKVQYIHTEATHTEMYTGQALFPELNKYITDHGFSVVNTLNPSYTFEDVIYKKAI